MITYTTKQKQILDFIFDYQKKEGVSPTLGEIAESLNVSIATIFGHITALRKKKSITDSTNEVRSYVIIDKDFLDKKEPDLEKSARAISIISCVLSCIKSRPNESAVAFLPTKLVEDMRNFLGLPAENQVK